MSVGGPDENLDFGGVRSVGSGQKWPNLTLEDAPKSGRNTPRPHEVVRVRTSVVLMVQWYERSVSPVKWVRR